MKNYNPDILNCLANLSSDEVFTPPNIATKMLDLLPQKLFSDPNAKFLDPISKSGVFLRAIAKRMLTAYMSRRSLYCSTRANSKHSVTHFPDEDGNIFFEEISHTWDKNRKCIYCGVNQKDFGDEIREGLSKYAYPFIHNLNPYENMNFDVIIGNPPYHLNVGNDKEKGNSSKAKAIYHLFIDQAIKMNPKYICMIIPSRWMTRSTEGVSEKWIDKMLSSNKFRIIHDFLDAKGIFSGTPPKGGVNYFLWDRDYNGECHYYLYESANKPSSYRFEALDKNNSGIIIRDRIANDILKKISEVHQDYMKNGENFSSLISPKDFFTNKQWLTSSWNGFANTPNQDYNIKYYPNKILLKNGANFGWININQIPKNRETKDLHKVFIPAAGGSGTDTHVLGHPFYGEPNSVCSQTYLVIGYNQDFTKEECLNIISYINTRFFRYLVSIKKKTQNGARGVYQFVPIQDFDKPWTDAELYDKYSLTEEEIAYIESLVSDKREE